MLVDIRFASRAAPWLLLGCLVACGGSAPTGSVSVETTPSSNAPTDLLSALKSHYEGCYKAGLKRDAKLQGKLSYELVDCPACDAKLDEDTLGDDEVKRCILSRVRKDGSKTAGMMMLNGMGNLSLGQQLTFSTE